MLRPLAALMLVLTLAACSALGHGDATLSLKVSGDVPGMEGSVIFLHVDRSREQLDWGNYTAPIPSGHHVVSVDTATCVGNCSVLDPALEQCRNTVDVPVGRTLAIEIVGSNLMPGNSCEISVE